MVKINVTYEEVSAYKKQVFIAEVNPNFSYKLRLTESQLDELTDKMKEKIDNRVQEWKSYIDELVYTKMQAVLPKGVHFNYEWTKETPAVIEAIRNEIIKITQLDKYKPKQKSIAEAINKKK